MPKGFAGRTKIDKQCPVCGKAFQVVKGVEHQKTCSRECGRVLTSKANERQVACVCKSCGKRYMATASRAKVSEYCSLKCVHKRNDTTRPCVVCGKPFRSPPSQMHVKTCSTACGYKARLVANKKDKIRVVCKQCGKPFFDHPCHAGKRVYCSKECHEADPAVKQAKRERMSGEKAYNWKGDALRRVVSASGKGYTRVAREVEAHKSVVGRMVTGKLVMPKWADLDKILWFYRETERLTKGTGIKYEVDHIVPLKSKCVTGLHCESNLQVIPATINRSKNNRFWPDMP